MIHLDWEERDTIKQVKCVHTNSKKYTVESQLTPGNIYDVKNETDEFIFIIDDSDRIAGYHKYYFEEIE